jgi:hypothetical protein
VSLVRLSEVGSIKWGVGGVRKFVCHPPLFLIHQLPQKLTMSQQAENDPHPAEEYDSTPSSSRWKPVWTSNKGIFFIILAQAVGSTMDAIVRFLQQGGHGIHPFQVNIS